MNRYNQIIYVTEKEKFNTYSHLLATFIWLLLSILLLSKVIITKQYNELFATIVYLVGILFVYLSSTLYHAINQPKIKLKARIIDHCSIFISLAATYTPLILIAFKDPFSITIFILLWILALIGCIYEIKLGIHDYTKSRKIPYFILSLLSVLTFLLLPKFLMTFTLLPILLVFTAAIFFFVGSYYYLSSKKRPEKDYLYHGIWHIYGFLSTFMYYIFYYFFVYS